MKTLAIGFTLTAALMIGGSAFAQPKARDRIDAIQKLIDCRALADNAARLACFDTTATALDQAEAKGEIVVIEREQVKAVRKQAFGFSLPSLNLFDRSEKGEPVERLDHITATATRAYQNNGGKWVIELEGGAVWIQTDSEPLPRGAKTGSTVEIREAAMGSFLVNVDKQRAIRAQRAR